MPPHNVTMVPNQSVDHHQFAALGQDEDEHENEMENENEHGFGQGLGNIVAGNEAMMGDVVDDMATAGRDEDFDEDEEVMEGGMAQYDDEDGDGFMEGGEYQMSSMERTDLLNAVDTAGGDE